MKVMLQCKKFLRILAVWTGLEYCARVLLSDAHQMVQLNVTAKDGGQTTLPCRLSPPEVAVTAVRWSKLEDNGRMRDFYVIDGRRKAEDLWDAAQKVDSAWLLRSFFSLHHDPALLKVGRVFVQDTGTYVCTVTYEGGKEVNRTVRLIVVEPPSPPVIYSEQGSVLSGVIGPFDEGSPLTLSCEVSGGRPFPQLAWTGSGYSLSSPNVNSVRIGNVTRSTLRINSLKRDLLLSVFTCYVVHAPSPMNTSVTVDMNLRPLSIHLSGRENFSVAGASAEFHCRVLGSRPPARLSWWLGTKLLEPFFYEVSDESEYTFTVVIDSFEAKDHGRTLRCHAEHPTMPGAVLEAKWNLDIHYPPSVKLLLGKGIKKPVILEGTDAYLECSVDSNPAPNLIQWYHDGRQLDPGGGSDPGVVVSGHYLIFQRARPSLTGEYSCTAANVVGKNDSSALHLTVQYPPRCAHISASYNVNVTVTCRVTSVPEEVEFLWSFRNRSGEYPVPSANPVTSNGTTSVLYWSQEDAGEDVTLYCRGKNAVGLQRSPCALRTMGAGQPHPLRDCAVSNHSDERIYVACGYPQPRPGDLFSLEVYSGQKLTLNVTRPTPVFWIPSLEPGTESLLLLFVVTSKGRSSPFKLVVQTDPYSAPLASLVKITNDAWLTVGTLLQVVLPLAVLASTLH